jgi:alpha-galactosidase
VQNYKIWILSLLLLRATMACASAVFRTNQFCNILREPDTVSVVAETGSYALMPERKGVWSNGTVKVRFHSRGKELTVELAAPAAAVKWLQIRWDMKFFPSRKYLGDDWERAYGDLEWKPLNPERVMPWYDWSGRLVLLDG